MIYRHLTTLAAYIVIVGLVLSLAKGCYQAIVY
jgi:hypothetical protein